MKRTRGFSLVELVVVVGILCILASIMVGSVQDARNKAMTSRAKSDLNAFALAVEVYTVDHSSVARMRHAGYYGDPEIDFVFGEAVNGTLSQVVTTPVAYISNVLVVDPFMAKENLAPLDIRFYTYQDIGAYCDRNKQSRFWPASRNYYGQWRFCSVGPDKVFDQGFQNSSQLPYDPTNGIISAGNIWRGQTGWKSDLPPIPGLLGEH